MVETQARVVRTEGEFAYVEAQQASSCGSCASSGKGCGVSLLGQLFGGRSREFRVLNQVGAQAGEQVVIGLADHALLKSSLLVYLLPLLLLFIGAGMGLALAPSLAMSESYSIITGFFGLMLGFAAVRWYAGRQKRNAQFLPVILHREKPVFIHKVMEI